MLDMQPRYAPSSVIVRQGTAGARLPVTSFIVHPPGDHPSNCPLRKDVPVLELRTSLASRWYGVEKGWINSELRMVVQGFPANFEEMARWEHCNQI